jgi:hypothetical protein
LEAGLENATRGFVEDSKVAELMQLKVSWMRKEDIKDIGTSPRKPGDINMVDRDK